MTAEIELLPLPETLVRSGFKSSAEAYAHANVAHATAAKDAEIEALRVRADAMAGEAIKHEARAERLAEEIDWIKSQPEGDRMFAEIEAAAKASFHRHRTSCRGQVLTRADNYESHLVWATLEWAKRTNGAEQRAERLAEALRLIESAKDRGFGIDYARGVAQSALHDHDQEVGNG